MKNDPNFTVTIQLDHIIDYIRDFLLFRRMILPYLIVILFMITIVCSFSQGISILFEEKNASLFELFSISEPTSSSHPTSVAIYWFFTFPLMIRIVLEIMIVVFRISETLTDIHNSNRR